MGLRIKDGFRQVPSTKIILNREFKLEQVIEHLASKNKYQIKEIQDKGFVAHWLPSKVKAYISYLNIHEYI